MYPSILRYKSILNHRHTKGPQRYEIVNAVYVALGKGSSSWTFIRKLTAKKAKVIGKHSSFGLFMHIKVCSGAEMHVLWGRGDLVRVWSKISSAKVHLRLQLMRLFPHPAAPQLMQGSW